MVGSAGRRLLTRSKGSTKLHADGAAAALHQVANSSVGLLSRRKWNEQSHGQCRDKEGISSCGRKQPMHGKKQECLPCAQRQQQPLLRCHCSLHHLCPSRPCSACCPPAAFEALLRWSPRQRAPWTHPKHPHQSSKREAKKGGQAARQGNKAKKSFPFPSCGETLK